MSSVMRFDEWQDSNGVPVASATNGVGAFNDSETITATDASWPVPALASPIVKVTVIGAGGGGGGLFSNNNGTDGGTTTFDAGGAGTVTAAGGLAGKGNTGSAKAGNAGLASDNGGLGGKGLITGTQGVTQENGSGGAITVAYLDLAGISTVDVTIGAGGVGGAGGFAGAGGGTGGRGEVIVEYVAG
jgi:hypothetical protein